MMNILLISYRDIHAEDAGGSRTTILKCNYLASIPGIRVFTAYRNLSPVDERIVELPLKEVTIQTVHKLVEDNKIDILDIPEGERYAALGRKAVAGTACLVITEFHSKPGYEMIGLRHKIVEYGSVSIFGQIKTYFKLFLYPLYKWYWGIKSLPNFRAAVLCSDKLVVLAPSFIEEYKKKYRLPHATNIVAIGNPLTFNNPIKPEQWCEKEKTILIVSRLDESKRISIVLRAWTVLQKQFPEWCMQIVGSGQGEAKYRAMIDKLHLRRVTLEGRQSPESYYTRASIFLMTSAYEGWGMTITEALEKGCVPVAMNSYSSLESIINDGQDGFIVPNNDLDAFIDKISLLMSNEVLRHDMARKGCENCQRFTMDKIGRQWIELFDNLLKQK